MRIYIKTEYDGTNFCGWQRQPDGVSVQEEIENAIFALTGERVSVVGSGRTDAGVHAAEQVAHFDTESGIPPEKFSFALNALLPPDIGVNIGAAFFAVFALAMLVPLAIGILLLIYYRYRKRKWQNEYNSGFTR